jgi:hypothetical protein
LDRRPFRLILNACQKNCTRSARSCTLARKLAGVQRDPVRVAGKVVWLQLFW